MQVFWLKKYFFVKKSKIFALRDRCFFDLSDHFVLLVLFVHKVYK